MGPLDFSGDSRTLTESGEKARDNGPLITVGYLRSSATQSHCMTTQIDEALLAELPSPPGFVQKLEPIALKPYQGSGGGRLSINPFKDSLESPYNLLCATRE